MNNNFPYLIADRWYWSSTRAATYLGVTRRQAVRLAQVGKIRSYRLGRNVLLDQSDCINYAAERRACNRYGVVGGKAAAERLGVG